MIDETRVLVAIAEFLRVPLADVQADKPLKDLVRDSFLLVELVIELQESTGARLDQADLAQVKTAGDLARLVASRAR